MAEKEGFTVRDTILYTSKPVDRSVPKAIYRPIISKKQPPTTGRHGPVETRKVSPSEMERLWNSRKGLLLIIGAFLLAKYLRGKTNAAS